MKETSGNGRDKPEKVIPQKKDPFVGREFSVRDGATVFEKKTPSAPHGEKLRKQDEILLGAYKASSYHEDPQTDEERVQNKLNAIFYLGDKLGILANGITRYHNPIIRTDFQTARQNLVEIITEDSFRDPSLYRDGVPEAEYINDEGVLVDENDHSVKTGGSSSPYLVIFTPEVIGADRHSGIPGEFHKHYLVPDEINRQEIQAQLHGENIPPERLAKIITYDEFLEHHQEQLPEDWMRQPSRDTGHQERVTADMTTLANEARMSSTWERATDLFLTEIANTENDTEYRRTAIARLLQIHNWFDFRSTQEEILQRGQETFWNIVQNPDDAEDVRNFALRKILLEEDEAEQLLPIALDTNEPISLRGSIIVKAAKQSENTEVAQTLTAIAQDPEEDISLRHHTLFSLQGAHPEIINTYLTYLAEGNDQGKKIAMKKLLEAPLLEPEENVFEGVQALSQNNTRGDTQASIDKFSEKFEYITHPEKYAQFTPESWEDFQEKLRSLIFARGGLTKEDILDRNNGLLVYLVRGVHQGTLRITDMGDGGIHEDDIALGLKTDTNLLGFVRGQGGGNGVRLARGGSPSKVQEKNAALKKVVLVNPEE